MLKGDEAISDTVGHNHEDERGLDGSEGGVGVNQLPARGGAGATCRVLWQRCKPASERGERTSARAVAQANQKRSCE
jgi:hypothetical protein